jgi:hypothetical protein
MSRLRFATLLGWTHLLGGIAGLAGFLLPSRSVGNQAAAWPAYWYAVGTPLAGLSVVSGLLLLRRRPGARRVASVVEGLQALGFHTGGFGFLFHSGLQVTLLVTPAATELGASAMSQFGVGPAMRVAQPFVMIDLLTPVALWLLWRTRARAAQPAATPA